MKMTDISLEPYTPTQEDITNKIYLKPSNDDLEDDEMSTELHRAIQVIEFKKKSWIIINYSENIAYKSKENRYLRTIQVYDLET